MQRRLLSYLSLWLTGDTCENNIDECDCDAVGMETDGCIDLINDFSCLCKAGYTGKNCSVSLAFLLSIFVT